MPKKTVTKTAKKVRINYSEVLSEYANYEIEDVMLKMQSKMGCEINDGEFIDEVIKAFFKANPSLRTPTKRQMKKVLKNADNCVFDEYDKLREKADFSAYPCRNSDYELAENNLLSQAAFNCGGPDKFYFQGVPKIVSTAIDSILYADYRNSYHLY